MGFTSMIWPQALTSFSPTWEISSGVHWKEWEHWSLSQDSHASCTTASPHHRAHGHCHSVPRGDAVRNTRYYFTCYSNLWWFLAWRWLHPLDPTTTLHIKRYYRHLFPNIRNTKSNLLSDVHVRTYALCKYLRNLVRLTQSDSVHNCYLHVAIAYSYHLAMNMCCTHQFTSCIAGYVYSNSLSTAAYEFSGCFKFIQLS